jgi:hypothetical protein
MKIAGLTTCFLGENFCSVTKKWGGGLQALEPSLSKSGGLEPSGLIEVYAYGSNISVHAFDCCCFIFVCLESSTACTTQKKTLRYFTIDFCCFFLQNTYSNLNACGQLSLWNSKAVELPIKTLCRLIDRLIVISVNKHCLWKNKYLWRRFRQHAVLLTKGRFPLSYSQLKSWLKTWVSARF